MKKILFVCFLIYISLCLLLVGCQSKPSFEFEFNEETQSYILMCVEGRPKDITIPEKYNDGNNGEHVVTHISSNAFSTVRYYVKSLSLPDTIEVIEDGSFQQMKELREITIPSSVQYLGHTAFFQNLKLENVTIKAPLEEIKMSAFNGCSSLQEIILPETLIEIGSNAFSATGLKKIVLPANIRTIENGAFSKNENLIIFLNIDYSIKDSITFGENWNGNNPVIWNGSGDIIRDNNFVYGKTNNNQLIIAGYEGNEESLIIGRTVKVGNKEYPIIGISNSAFQNSHNLSELYIPNNIIQVGEYICLPGKDITINCQASSKPLSWSDMWQITNTVNWNVSL